MTDDCGVAIDDDALFDDEDRSLERRIVEFLPAAMIVVLAYAIASALLRSPEPDVGASMKSTRLETAADAPPPVANANFRVAALHLRSALKEIASDRTGTIPAPTVTPTPPVRVLPHVRPPRVEHRTKPAAAASDTRSQSNLAATHAAKARATNPLTVVGRTAGAMAERFSADLRALPSQISAIFKGR